LQTTARRILSDVFMWADPRSYDYFSRNIFPSVDIIINLGKLFSDITTLKEYEKDSKYGYEGWKKWYIDLTYVVPGGSALRQGWALGLWMYRKSAGEVAVQKYSNMNDEYVRRLKDVAKYGNNPELAEYAMMIEALMRKQQANQRDAAKALWMKTYEEYLEEHPDDKKIYNEIMKAGKKYEEDQEKIRHLPERKLKKKLRRKHSPAAKAIAE
jgi:hypothetical protein